MLYAKVSEIVSKYIEMDIKNFALLRNSLWQFKNIFQYVYSRTYPDRNSFWQFKNIFQYVYSRTYPDIYCTTEQRGFNIKSSFYIVYKNCKDKKKQELLGRNPQIFAAGRQNSFENEQKPVKIDDFNSDEEKRVKERVEERKRKRRE